MKYFLILFVFYTMNSFAQQEIPRDMTPGQRQNIQDINRRVQETIPEQGSSQRFTTGQKVSVLRSDGSFSNATVIDVNDGRVHVYIENVERGRSGGGTKSIPLDQVESRITKPLKIPGGFIKRGDVVSIPRTRGGRSNGLIVDIDGTKARVEWIDQEGQKFFKWVDVSETDRRIDVNPPTQLTRPQTASHIGQNPNRPGLARRAASGLKKMAKGSIGIALALVGVASEVVRGETHILETPARLADESGFSAETGNSDTVKYTIDDILEELKTSVQELDPEQRFSQERQMLSNKLRTLYTDVQVDTGLSDEEKQQHLATIAEIQDIAQPSSPTRRPPNHRNRRRSSGHRN